MRDDVLIVGAGPTGLVLALLLTKQGLKVRIIDKTAGPGTTSRALAVQARTLELYRQLGLSQAVVAGGYKTPALNFWVKGQRKAHLPLSDTGEGLTPYSFVLIYPQDQHERLLVERLEELGVTVERQTEFLSFEEHADFVSTRLRTADGTEQICEARFLAGCDGARSPIRHELGSGFEGGTYDHYFYVADVHATGPIANGEIHVGLEETDFLVVFPYSNDGHSRLIGTIRDDRMPRDAESGGTAAGALTFEDVGHRAMEDLGLEVSKVNWFSTYKVHHRVTSHYRHGRTFLLGDAAHVHSPVGGQGMNTGIGDAFNLAWKLAAVARGEAPDSVLDTYEAERKAFARKLVETTDRVFTFVTAESSFAEFARTRIAPLFVSVAYRAGAMREFLFRLVSQTMISYHDSALSEGQAGSVHAGDRLPWVPAGDIDNGNAGNGGVDNFDSLTDIAWQVHVYGTAGVELPQWCASRGLRLSVFEHTEAHEKAGLQRDAIYLLRPDTYVAFADPSGSVEALANYLSRRELKIGT